MDKRMWGIWGGMGLFLLVGAFLVIFRMMQLTPTITTFEECAAAGYPVMEKYPPVCRTPDGQMFTQQVRSLPPLDTNYLIRVQAPQVGQVVNTPLLVSGEARGTWFFEASFPIILQDATGVPIASAIATAQGEWMTEEFVPFTATLPIPPTFQGPATLVLQKDNPSGLPEHDSSISIPVTVAAK